MPEWKEASKIMDSNVETLVPCVPMGHCPAPTVTASVGLGQAPLPVSCPQGRRAHWSIFSTCGSLQGPQDLSRSDDVLKKLSRYWNSKQQFRPPYTSLRRYLTNQVAIHSTPCFYFASGAPGRLIYYFLNALAFFPGTWNSADFPKYIYFLSSSSLTSSPYPFRYFLLKL